MDTTTAATQANVTVDTIRTWCRMGAVAAVKRAGQWIIDETSLRARITLGRQMHRAALTRRAAAARARILAALPLPRLTGTPKQIAWAEDIRARRIEHGLAVNPHRIHSLVYRLVHEQLGASYLGITETHTTEADALAALTATISTPERQTAAWWISRRAMTAPC